MDFQALATEALLAQNGMAPKCFVKFRYEAVRNAARSEAEGVDQFDNVEMCEMFIPGSRDSFNTVVTDQIKREYAAQYNAWKQGEERPVDGIPLSEWAELAARPDTVASLKALHIHTLEQLAEASDTAVTRLGMGAMALREKAKKTIESMSDSGVLRRTIEENETLKLKVKDQEEQIKELAERVKELEKSKKAK